jgi:hypothetical protein
VQAGDDIAQTTGWLAGRTDLLVALMVLLAGLVLAAWGWAQSRKARVARGADQEAMRDAERLGADLRELTQRLAHEMDAKADRIERLLAKADERIARLQDPPPALQRVHDRSASAGEPEHAKVHALADEGLPIVEIARRVGKPTGQVELILALRRGSVSL